MKSVEKEALTLKDNKFWQEIIKLKPEGGLDWICNCCLQYLKKNERPAYAISNKLMTVPVPPEISCLNDCEKLLIQRAKCFQKITTTSTVMNKKLPFKEQMKKLTGTVWYLPLPLEETINKLCQETDVLNKNHELHVLVRSVPKKDKSVWENLVDVKKVWNALVRLKEMNHFYDKVNLPPSVNDLRKVINGLENPEFEIFYGETEDRGTKNPHVKSESEKDQAQAVRSNIKIDSLNDSKQNEIIDNLSGSLSSMSIDNENEMDQNKEARNNFKDSKHNEIINDLSGSLSSMSIDNDNEMEKNKVARNNYEDQLSGSLSSVDLNEDSSSKKVVNDKLSSLRVNKPAKIIDLDGKKHNGILTCVSQSHPFYDQYTIYPVSGSRINENPSKLYLQEKDHAERKLYQQVKVHAENLKHNLEGLDMLCFPDVFPTGQNGQKITRETRLRDCDYIKRRLLSIHPRYRRNIQYLFYLLNDCTM